MKATHGPTTAPEKLNFLLKQAGLGVISEAQEENFTSYLALLMRWNGRINLTAVREAAAIQKRHFVESIACAQLLPRGIGSLLDYGSGAGFPGIPIALCRPDIRVMLAESKSKKAAFLLEAVRTMDLDIRVYANRAERLSERFDCVTLRAVDRMELAVTSAANLVNAGGWLAVMTTRREVNEVKAVGGRELEWSDPISLPTSDQQILALARREQAKRL